MPVFTTSDGGAMPQIWSSRANSGAISGCEAAADGRRPSDCRRSSTSVVNGCTTSSCSVSATIIVGVFGGAAAMVSRIAAVTRGIASGGMLLRSTATIRLAGPAPVWGGATGRDLAVVVAGGTPRSCSSTLREISCSC
jgi:hypothetical protein